MIYEDDRLFGNQTSPTGSVMAEPSSTGIGIATGQTASAAPQLSTAQRIGRRLYNFSAGMEGRPTFEQREQDAKLKKRRADLDELKTVTDAMANGLKIIEGLDGPDRAKAVEFYGAQLDRMSPGMRDTFTAMASKPALLQKFEQYVPYLPAPLQELARRDPKAFLKFSGTAEGLKALNSALDSKELRTATRKVRALVAGWQQLAPAEQRDLIKDGLTASDVFAVQAGLPEPLRFSDTELDAIKRNDKTFFSGTGILHGDGELKILEYRAKKAGERDKAPQTLTVDGQVYQYDPGNKVKGKRLSSDARYALMGKAGTGDDQKRIIDVELKLSDDYARDTKKFSERRPLFDSATSYMAERSKNKTSAGDAALMFAYAKMRDPNDRLAVSETRDLVKLGNIFERFGVSVQAVLDKGETLPDRVAKEMYAEIRRSFREQNRQQIKTEEDYRKRAKDYGGNPDRVVRSHAIQDKDFDGQKGKFKVGDTVKRGGKTWKVVGFDADGEPLVEPASGGTP